MYWAIAIALMEAHFVLFLEHSLIALDIEIPSLLFGDFWWKVIFFFPSVCCCKERTVVFFFYLPMLLPMTFVLDCIFQYCKLTAIRSSIHWAGVFLLEILQSLLTYLILFFFSFCSSSLLCRPILFQIMNMLSTDHNRAMRSIWF